MIPGSNKDHPSFLKSFSYAMEGFVTAVKTERNIKAMLVAGVCTVIAASWGSTLPSGPRLSSAVAW